MSVNKNDIPDPEPFEDDEARDPEADAGGEQQPLDDPTYAADAHADADDPLATLQVERDELYERLQRVSADYQNYMRRSQQNLAQSVELARGDLAKQFIPVLDHFDNALAEPPTSDEAVKLYEGLRIVRDELLRVLQGAGIERIDVEVGQPFDPNIHEAMLRQPAEGVEPNSVSAFMQPGYRHGDRTLRPAKVAVAPAD